MSYVRDVGALARKDLLLELRARDTLPAMLLFVAATFVIFHFAVPGAPSRLETSGLLWIAILFTALLGLGRAFVPEREQQTMDGLVLAPCDRSAIWVAKSLATLAFLVAAEVVALPLYALFFHHVDARTVAAVFLADLGICGVGTFLGAMAVATRARDTLPAMLLFVAAVFVVFHFAVPGTPSKLETSGLLWVAILFTALLGLGRAFVPEREQRTMDGLVLAPCDRSAIWLAKSLATLAFLAAAEVVALPLYALFFHGLDGATVAAVILADLGICAVGTFLGAMAVATRARDLLLPLLFLPLAIPIVVGAVGASVAGSPGRYLGFLGLYDLLFAVVCWASFEYVVSE